MELLRSSLWRGSEVGALLRAVWSLREVAQQAHCQGHGAEKGQDAPQLRCHATAACYAMPMTRRISMHFIYHFMFIS